MKDMMKEYDPSYPIIVGLAGKAATGKTSVAQTIVPMASFNNTRGGIVWEHLFFAMPLYEFYSVRTKIEGLNSQSRKLYGIHETLYNLYGSSPIGNIPSYDNFINLVHAIGEEKLDSDGSKPRSFLQNVGDLCREYDEKCFANWGIRKVSQIHKEYLKTIEEDKEPSPYCVLISDVRFKNEADAILARPNGMIIRFDTDDEIRRERIFKRDGVYMTDEQMNHRSEQEIDLFSNIVSAVVNSSSVSVEDQSSATMEAVKESFGLKNYAKN